MIADQALAAVMTHYQAGREAHPDFTSPPQALGALHYRLILAQQEYFDQNRPDRRDRLCRRLLQLAGLCVKTVVNLDLREPDQTPS